MSALFTITIYWGVEMSIILQMTKDFALDISSWSYETPYSRYSFPSNSETMFELLNGDYYVFIMLKMNCWVISASENRHRYQ